MKTLFKIHLTSFIKYLLNKETNKNVALYSTFFVTISSLFGNFFSYLFQLIIAKALSVSEFGDLNALFSLLVFLSAPVSILSVSLVKIVSKIKDKDYPKKFTEFFYTIFVFSFFFSFVISLLLFLSRNFLLYYLQISQPAVFITFVFYVFVIFFASLMPPLLQALQRFKAYSFLTFLQNFLRFLVAMLALFFSLSLNSVFQIFIFTSFVSIVLGVLILKKNLQVFHLKIDFSYIRSLTKYLAFSSFAVLGLTFLLSLDVVLVKHFFTPELAGIYSSVSVLGKIIFWLSGPVILVAFPMFSEKHSKGELPFKHFLLTLLAVFTISAVGFLFMWFSPKYLINILFGNKYILASTFLPYYSIFVVLFSLNSLFTYFYISIEKSLISTLPFIALVSEYLLVHYFFNSTLFSVINALILVQSVVLALFSLYFSYIYFLYNIKKSYGD